MVDRPWIIRIGHTHGADRKDDARGQVVEIAEQNGRYRYACGDSYGAVEIMAVDKPLIFPNIIHVVSENTGKLSQTNFYAITFVNYIVTLKP